MRCRKVRRSLLAALDGELAPAEREVVRAHVAACAACRAIEAEAVRLHRALADLPQAASLPAGLAEATMRRVRAEAAAERPARRLLDARGTWWWLAAPVAAGIVGIALWRALPADVAPSTPGAPPPLVASRPAAPAVEPPPQAVARVRPAEKAPKAPAASQQAAATPPSPPPQVAEALELFLDMPILENMEKLQNFDAIRTVDLGDERQEERRG